jgi:hypothetical protein
MLAEPSGKIFCTNFNGKTVFSCRVYLFTCKKNNFDCSPLLVNNGNVLTRNVFVYYLLKYRPTNLMYNLALCIINIYIIYKHKR